MPESPSSPDGSEPISTAPVATSPESTPDFKRGSQRGVIAFVVFVVFGVVAVLALSGVFGTKKKARVVEPDNKEGGCPCSCDRSDAMLTDLRSMGGNAARRAIDKSLSAIAEREAAGYITEAMVSHRLRLLDFDRGLSEPRGAQGASPEERQVAAPGMNSLLAAGSRAGRPALRVMQGGRLRAGMELVVHGQTTEWVQNRQKPLRACFLLSMEIENLTDSDRVVTQPAIVGSVPFPISRWYVRGGNGEAWSGDLKAREHKSVHVIGYLGEPVSPKTPVQAAIQFEASTFHATTRARSRWNHVEPTHTTL